jgi:gamma-glutamylcyclotransferase (GGCT)/AIG2-like uncharacterized protein YtfP
MRNEGAESEVHCIFVYGTLMRNEEREGYWPRAPLSVEPAETRGALYDLGEYPALLEGDDWIGGELWTLRPEDMFETLLALDRIEWFGQDDVDLYVRRVIRCHTLRGEAHAYAYFLADPSQAIGQRRIAPNADGVCRWGREWLA